MKRNPTSNAPPVRDFIELPRRTAALEKRCGRAEEELYALQEQIRLLSESSPFGIVVFNIEGLLLRVNQKMLDMWSWPASQDITQLNIFKHEPLVNSGVADAFRRCMEKRMPVTSDHSYLTSRNRSIRLRYHICPVIDNDQRFSGIIAFVEDVTELKLAEEAIIAGEKRYRLLFESAPVAMVQQEVSDLRHHLEQLRVSGIADLPGYFDRHPRELIHCMELIKTIDYNTAFLDLMEARTWDEIDSFLRGSRIPDYVNRMAQEIVLSVADGSISNERENTVVTIRGAKKNILAKSLPLAGPEGSISRMVVAAIDITKRKEAEEALRASEQRFREQAMRDDLTGLYNRRYLFHSLAELVEHAKIKGLPVSVIFMDLDHFKDVVDTYGHLNGSLVIKEVGQTIQEITKRPAYAVAYAGDEFVVVLPDHSPEQTLCKAKEIRDRMRTRVFLQDKGFEVRIRSSFGIATFPYHAEGMIDLLAAADKALFIAKGAGKDRIRCAV